MSFFYHQVTVYFYKILQQENFSYQDFIFTVQYLIPMPNGNFSYILGNNSECFKLLPGYWFWSKQELEGKRLERTMVLHDASCWTLEIHVGEMRCIYLPRYMNEFACSGFLYFDLFSWKFDIRKTFRCHNYYITTIILETRVPQSVQIFFQYCLRCYTPVNE